jgi:gamma-glutamylcyclotransferase (GGCT)/AIG2-like uncharacterized protein YtfP
MNRYTNVRRHQRRTGFNKISNVIRHFRRSSPTPEKKVVFEYVFVYGTLMKGQRLNYMLKDSELITEYTLKDHLRIWPETIGFPIIVKNSNHSVQGEIYAIDKDVSKFIDRVEIQAGYEIRHITVELPTGKKVSVKYYYPLERLQKEFERVKRQESRELLRISQDVVKHHKDLVQNQVFSITSLWQRLYVDLSDRRKPFLKQVIVLVEQSEYEEKDSLASILREEIENDENYDHGFFQMRQFFPERN